MIRTAIAEPENQARHLLRELRVGQDDLRAGLRSLDQKIDYIHDDLGQRIKNLQQAMIGESVLGRYAVAEVEERLDAIEKRLTVLEKS